MKELGDKTATRTWNANDWLGVKDSHKNLLYEIARDRHAREKKIENRERVGEPMSFGAFH